MSPRPLGVRLLVVFFTLAALVCAASVISLASPGTLDALWRFKPQAREGFVGMGPLAFLLLAAVGGVMGVAAVGLWRLRPWGWWAAVGAFAINGLSDGAHALLASDYREIVGLPVVALLIWYLCRPRVRQLFRIGAPSGRPG